MKDKHSARRGGSFHRYAARTTVFLYLGALVALPIGMVFWYAFRGGFGPLIEALSDEEAIAAYQLTFSAAAIVTVVNAVLGTLAAYTLVRVPFPGRAGRILRRFLDMVVDLPLALPTSVTGLTLAAILGPQSPFGAFLEARGWNVLYEPAAVYIACAVITLPFVIRAVEPILLTLDRTEEEAAVMLGAKPLRIFFSIVLPTIRPGIMAGAALAFARSLGEFGAVVFVAGTEPFRTQVAATFVYTRIESSDLPAAAAAAVVVLSVSYMLFALVRRIESISARRPA